MALRLKYAGMRQEDMIMVLPAPLRAAIRSLDVKERRKLRRRRSAKSLEAQPIALNEKDVMSRSPVLSAPLSPVNEDMLDKSARSGGRKEYGIAKALDAAISRTPAGETLFVVPTYTGLLEVHRELERRGLTPHYWEEKGP
jgi:hypothetical protein